MLNEKWQGGEGRTENSSACAQQTDAAAHPTASLESAAQLVAATWGAADSKFSVQPSTASGPWPKSRPRSPRRGSPVASPGFAGRGRDHKAPSLACMGAGPWPKSGLPPARPATSQVMARTSLPVAMRDVPLASDGATFNAAVPTSESAERFTESAVDASPLRVVSRVCPRETPSFGGRSANESSRREPSPHFGKEGRQEVCLPAFGGPKASLAAASRAGSRPSSQASLAAESRVGSRPGSRGRLGVQRPISAHGDARGAGPRGRPLPRAPPACQPGQTPTRPNGKAARIPPDRKSVV